jgi:hypothetical protein
MSWFDGTDDEISKCHEEDLYEPWNDPPHEEDGKASPVIQQMYDDGDLEALKPLDAVYDQLAEALPNVGPENMMIAGGAVRDLLIGQEPKDFDVYVNVKPCEGRFARLMGQSQGRRLQDLRDSLVDHFKSTHIVQRLISKSTLNKASDGPAIVILANLVDFVEESLDATLKAMLLDDPDFARFLANSPGLTTEAKGGHVFGKKVQVICSTYTKDLRGIISNFDLDICMYGYNKEGLIMGDMTPTMPMLRKKMTGEVPVEMGTTHIIRYTRDRIEKFTDRYGCDMSNVEKALSDLKGQPNGDRVQVFYDY